LQPKEGYQSPSPAQLRELLRIDEESIEGMSKYDEQSEELLQSLQNGSNREATTLSHVTLPSTPARGVSFGRQENWFSVSIESETHGDETIEDEVTRCFELLNGKLPSIVCQRSLAKPSSNRVFTIERPLFDPNPAPKLSAGQHGRFPKSKQGIFCLFRKLTAISSLCRCHSSTKSARTT
jgi:hypothetical protein